MLPGILLSSSVRAIVGVIEVKLRWRDFSALKKSWQRLATCYSETWLRKCTQHSLIATVEMETGIESLAVSASVTVSFSTERHA